MLKFEPLDTSSPVPLYYQLAQIINKQIDSGNFKPGQEIWSEDEMTRMYGISKTSVRRAIQELVQKGVIVTQRGKRACVTRPKISRGFPGLTSFSEDMRKRNLVPGAKVLSSKRLPPTPEIRINLQLDENAKVFQIKRLMLANDEPIGLHIVNLPETVWESMGIEADYLNNRSLYQTLYDKGGFVIEEANETIEVGAADKEASKFLAIEIGFPILLMNRLVFTIEGLPIEHAINIYRSDRYSYEICHRRVTSENIL